MKALAGIAACAALPGCSAGLTLENAERMAALKRAYDGLHQRFEAAASRDPLVSAAFADRGSIVVAIRSSLIEDLAGTIAKRYLDNVAVDLENVKAKGSGEVRKKTLRAQDASGTCGTFMNPEKGATFLKDLAAKGVNVKLPLSIFRTVRLPASLRQEVTVNRRAVSLSIQGESLRLEAKTLWSSASAAVQTSPRP
jgi:hypothetical protein